MRKNTINYRMMQNTYLKIEVIRTMISKFLIEKKMSKENLAEILDISINELDELLSNTDISLIPKISLPLVKLYCETKFDNNQLKTKKVER